MDVDKDSSSTLDIEYGGTNASTPAGALANLGAEPAQIPASKAEMEAGTVTAIRSMSPKRVAEAIAVLAPAGIAYEPIQTAASQVEMEAGTVTAIRSMSPIRVKQAITALESTHTGVFEPVQTAASQAEMTAGTLATIRSMSPLRVAQAIAALSSGGHDAVTLDTDLGTNLLTLSTQDIALNTQAANIVFAGPATGGSVSPTFRSLVADDLPGTYVETSDIGTTVQAQIADQDANTVFCGPATGAADAPAFRALDAADIPDISDTYQAADADLDVAAGATAAAVSTYFGKNAADEVGFHALPSGSGLEFDIEAPGAAGGLLQSDGIDYARVDTLTGLTFGGFSNSMAVQSGATGALESSADVSVTELGYLNGVTSAIQTQIDTKAVKAIATKTTATTYTIGTTDANEAYGGVIYVTGACTVTAPEVASGMSFTVITIGDIAVSLDVNASDKMILDGVTLDDGDKATNTSNAGDMIVCTYYSADGWYCASGSNDGTLWSDGGA